MTDLFFALGSQELKKSFSTWDFEAHPVKALVTFAERRLIEDVRRYPFERLMLDSGAFSAWNSGKTIDLEALIVESKDPRYTDAVCLDVIGDAEASVRNSFAMKDAGSPAFPVFHIGDPWEHLELYKRAFGRVGLSCRFGEPVSASVKFLEQSFARAWPCRFHSFGWLAPEALSAFPFDSADASTWMVPRMYGHSIGGRHGRYFGFPKQHANIKRGHAGTLQPEIHTYLKLERYLAWRWAKELNECRSQNTSGNNNKKQSTPST